MKIVDIGYSLGYIYNNNSTRNRAIDEERPVYKMWMNYVEVLITPNN